MLTVQGFDFKTRDVGTSMRSPLVGFGRGRCVDEAVLFMLARNHQHSSHTPMQEPVVNLCPSCANEMATCSLYLIFTRNFFIFVKRFKERSAV